MKEGQTGGSGDHGVKAVVSDGSEARGRKEERCSQG